MYGARVVAIEGNFDAALRLVREIGATEPIAVVNSINPFRLQGQKTAAFEIIDELGDAPDFHVLPVGNAGNITAYWLGYAEFQRCHRAQRQPRMIGFQAAGAAPIFRNEIVEKPETVASAIRIGNPASWKHATDAIAQSHGAIDIVTDEEILAAQKWLATQEGIFVEPASAAGVAGLFKSFDRRRAAERRFPEVPAGSRIVCTLTGHGLKDPDVAKEQCGSVLPAPAEKDEILRIIAR
jgi:threonine synthase